MGGALSFLASIAKGSICAQHGVFNSCKWPKALPRGSPARRLVPLAARTSRRALALAALLAQRAQRPRKPMG